MPATLPVSQIVTLLAICNQNTGIITLPVALAPVGGSSALADNQRWRVVGIRWWTTPNCLTTDGLDHDFVAGLYDHDGFRFHLTRLTIPGVATPTYHPANDSKWIDLGDGVVGSALGPLMGALEIRTQAVPSTMSITTPGPGSAGIIVQIAARKETYLP